MKMALCAAMQIQEPTREATTAGITTREASPVDRIRKPARTCVSAAMTLKPRARRRVAAGALRGSAALTDAAAISPMTTALCAALDQAMATVAGAMTMITTVATSAATRETIHTRRLAAMSGDTATRSRRYASPVMAIGTRQLSMTIAIAVD